MQAVRVPIINTHVEKGRKLVRIAFRGTTQRVPSIDSESGINNVRTSESPVDEKQKIEIELASRIFSS